MKIQIDIKSATLGLLVGAAAMFTLGDATSSGGNGRFQIAVSGNQELVVDTQSGKVWGTSPSQIGRHDDGDKFWDAKSDSN